MQRWTSTVSSQLSCKLKEHEIFAYSCHKHHMFAQSPKNITGKPQKQKAIFLRKCDTITVIVFCTVKYETHIHALRIPFCRTKINQLFVFIKLPSFTIPSMPISFISVLYLLLRKNSRAILIICNMVGRFTFNPGSKILYVLCQYRKILYH